MFTAANAVGPAVAGITYASMGPAWCFTLNGVSFLAVIVALVLIKVKPLGLDTLHKSATKAMGEALHFVQKKRSIILLMATVFVTGMFGIGMMSLMPAWTVDILKGDASTNGWLLSARGVGSLLGALTVAAFSKRALRGRLWSIGSLLFPPLLLVFSFLRVIPLSLAFLVLIGWSFMIVTNTSNAMVQLRVPDVLRGRVMGLYTLVFFGSSPLGTLLLGTLAQSSGEPFALWVASGLMMCFFLFIWFRFPEVRTLE